jgi:hypothetical protein
MKNLLKNIFANKGTEKAKAGLKMPICEMHDDILNKGAYKRK